MSYLYDRAPLTRYRQPDPLPDVRVITSSREYAAELQRRAEPDRPVRVLPRRKSLPERVRPTVDRVCGGAAVGVAWAWLMTWLIYR